MRSAAILGIVIGAVALSGNALAQGNLGKDRGRGNGGGGGGSTPPPPPARDNGGGRGNGGGGGGSTPPPPVRDNGGGGGGGGQQSPPPATDRGRGNGGGGGGQQSPPPTTDRGRGNGGGGSTPPPTRDNGGGGQQSPPPARDNGGGGGLDRGRGNGGGGGDTNDRGRGGNSGGGQQSPPPTRDNGNGGGRGGDIGRGNGRDDNGGGRGGNNGGGNGRDGGSGGGGGSRADGLLGNRPLINNGNSYGGSVNNQRGRGDNQWSGPNGIPTSARSGSLVYQVNRTATISARSEYRSGYYGYDNRWCDDNFFYSHYCFQPVWGGSYFSPWYYYPSLPGYIVSSRVTYISINFGPFYGSAYDWKPARYNDYDRYSELDYALDDIVKAFERSDRRALGRLAPRRGNVNIWIDDNYAYSVNADDYYDMMTDAIAGVRTRNYIIDSVRRDRGGRVRVWARHEYLDPWNRLCTTYHNYGLEEDRYGYVITDFGTSRSRGSRF